MNGVDLKSANQEAAAAVLKAASGKVVLKVGRLKASKVASTANGKYVLFCFLVAYYACRSGANSPLVHIVPSFALHVVGIVVCGLPCRFDCPPVAEKMNGSACDVIDEPDENIPQSKPSVLRTLVRTMSRRHRTRP